MSSESISGVMPEASRAAPAKIQTASPEPSPVVTQSPPARGPKTLDEIAADAAQSLRRQAQRPDERQEAGTESSPEPETPETETKVLSHSNEPEAIADGDSEPEPERDEHQLPKGVVERIRKLKAQRKELRDKAAKVPELEAELAKARAELESARKPAESAPPAPTPPAATPGDGPLNAITDLAELDRKAQAAEAARETVEDLLDTLRDEDNGAETVAARLRSEGVKLTDSNGEEDWSPSRMREWLRGAREGAKRIEKAAPERRRWIETERAHLDRAVQMYPELQDAQSPLTQEVVQLMRERPDLRRNPTWPIDAVVGVLGRRALAQKAAPKSTPPATPPAKATVPRVPGAPRSSPTAVTVDEDGELMARVKAGQATVDEISRYGARSIAGAVKR